MKLKLLLSFLFFTLIVSCSATDTKYKVRITSYNGNFTGSYTIDGDKFGALTGTATNANVYLYEREFDIQENILLDVLPDPNTDTLSPTDDTYVTNVICRIYLDNSLVLNQSVTVTTTALITFEYKPGGTSNSTTK